MHVDIKKLGDIPGQGEWRFVGHAQGKKNRVFTTRRALLPLPPVYDGGPWRGSPRGVTVARVLSDALRHRGEVTAVILGEGR
jgi:hypothetical protein